MGLPSDETQASEEDHRRPLVTVGAIESPMAVPIP